MEVWEKKQRHHDEITRLLKENGCMDKQGRIRRWCSEMYQAMIKNGHTSLGFSCKCMR